FGPLWTWISSICAPWGGASASRYAGPFTARTAAPLLVVGNQYDPVTPYAGARKTADRLPNARLLTVHGWGHTSLFLSQCADAAVGHYLIDGVLPAVGMVCEQDSVPFVQPQPAQAAASMMSPRGRVNGALVPAIMASAPENIGLNKPAAVSEEAWSSMAIKTLPFVWLKIQVNRKAAHSGFRRKMNCSAPPI